MSRRELGKIQSIDIGQGGYQGAEIGIRYVLSGKGWGVVDWQGYWGTRPSHVDWTEEDRTIHLGKIFLQLFARMKEADVTDHTQLIGKPIEVIFNNNNTLVSWRLLIEVL